MRSRLPRRHGRTALALLGAAVVGLSLGIAAMQPSVPIVDNFESGDLSRRLWVSGGGEPWSVTNQQSHGGEFAARSGSVGHGETSWLELNAVTTDGPISFWYRVSSERFDALRFSIDGQLAGKWSGDTGWQWASYFLDAGPHRFRWAYRKDDSGSERADRAWIDDLAMPIDRRASQCTTVATPTDQLQAIVDEARSGDVICLGEGEWRSSIVVETSVTLRGVSRSQSIVTGDKPGEPTLWIRSPAPDVQTPTVTLEHLTIRGHPDRGCADWYADRCADGVRATDRAGVRISDARISGSGFHGLRVQNRAWVEIDNTVIAENSVNGVQLTERGRATLLRSTVEENGRDGVGATDGATLDLADIDLANNGDTGLEMDQFASGTLLNSTVSGNGAEGVQLGDSAELTLERNAIQNNHGFGVALHIWGCYGNQAADDRFHGKVAGRANTIPSRQADNGNKLGDVCPSALSFLTTDRGEAYPP
ncbi:MAG: right-handed parallel beta-helix repeat-containing protein [Candidatus Bipolaricaulia bacterium]